MGSFQSTVPVSEVLRLKLAAQYDQTERGLAIEELSGYAKDNLQQESSAFAKLVQWMFGAMAPNWDGADHVVQSELDDLIAKLAETQQVERINFRELLSKRPIIERDMIKVIFSTPPTTDNIPMRWKLVQIAHEYYGVAREYLFLFPLQQFSYLMTSTSRQTVNEINRIIAVKNVVCEWVDWCLSKEIIEQLQAGLSLAQQFLHALSYWPVDTWSLSILMERVYGRVRGNIRLANVQNAPGTDMRRDIERSPHAIRLVCFYLYPDLGINPACLSFDEMHRKTASWYLLTTNPPDMTVLQAICPRPQPSMPLTSLDDEVIRNAFTIGRLDIMLAYGFDSSYLKRTDQSLHSVLKLLRVDIREAVCHIFGLSAEETVLALINIPRSPYYR